MHFDPYLEATFQKQGRELRVLPRGPHSQAAAALVAKTTPDFHSAKEEEKAGAGPSCSELEAVPIRGVGRMLARKKRTCLDGLSVNLRSVRGEAHWPVPKEAGCFYLELYFIQANKTQISLYQSETAVSQNLLKLQEDRALVGIEINKNPPIENTFTLYVNGIRQENVLKFAPQDCEILIRAKKGFVYANPFVLQPLSCSAAPRAILPSFAPCHLSELLGRAATQTFIFKKSELPSDKPADTALIEKYMLTNGQLTCAQVNQTELVVTLSHPDDQDALRKTNGAKHYPLTNANASVLLDRFLDSHEAKLLSGYSSHFAEVFPNLSDHTGNRATELLEDCLGHVLSLSPAGIASATDEPDEVQFFPIPDPALPSLVIKKGTRVKSVPLRPDGTYDLTGLHFGEAPHSLDDQISVHLQLESVQTWLPVVHQLIWKKVVSRNIVGALLIPFLLKLAHLPPAKDAYLPTKYRDCILFFQTVLTLLHRELAQIATQESTLFAKLDNDQDKLDAVSELPFFGQPIPGESEEGVPPPPEVAAGGADAKTSGRDFTFHQVLEATRLVAEIEEQLYALSQSANAGQDIQRVWGSSPRLHTAFGRLASFTSAGQHLSDHSVYDLACAGLVAVRNEHSTSYRLWNAPGAFVPLSDLVGSVSPAAAIRKSYKHVYDSVLSRFEIPLSLTAKYLPAISLASSVDNIWEVKEAAGVLLVGYKDLSVALLSCKLRPIVVAEFGLRAPPPPSKEEVPADGSKPKRSKSEKKLDYVSDEDEGVGDLFPADDQQKPFEANNDLLQNMMMMGFDATLSNEALKKCNNQSLEAAIDAVIEIQNKIEEKFKKLAPEPAPAAPAPSSSSAPATEPQEKRKEIINQGTFAAIDLLQDSSYTDHSFIKYRIQAVVTNKDNAVFFQGKLQYSAKALQAVGQLHADQNLGRSEQGPRFDLQTILPLYTQSMESLMPLFASLAKPLFEFDAAQPIESNLYLIEKVEQVCHTLIAPNAGLIAINHYKELLIYDKETMSRQPAPENTELVAVCPTHVAGIQDGSTLVILPITDLKTPIATFPLKDISAIGRFELTAELEVIFQTQEKTYHLETMTKENEDIVIIREKESAKKAQAPTGYDGEVQGAGRIEMGLASLSEVELSERALSNYRADKPGGTRIAHFKRPQSLSGVEVEVAFACRSLKGQHLTKESSSRKYRQQVLAQYAGVPGTCEELLPLRLLSTNGPVTQLNLQSNLTSPKLGLPGESTEDENPYLSEMDKEFLFEHFDGKRMLVASLSFQMLFEWSNTSFLFYSADSLAELYAPTPDVPDPFSHAQSLLAQFKTNGTTPRANEPVAAVQLTKQEESNLPRTLHFPLQVKRPARYLRVRVVAKNSKQGSRFLTNPFHAYGCEAAELPPPQPSEWLPSGHHLKLELTMRRTTAEGATTYEQAKLDPVPLNVVEVLTPEKPSNEPISKLIHASDAGITLEGPILCLAKTIIPLAHDDVIGLKAWVEPSEDEGSGDAEEGSPLSPAEVKIQCRALQCPRLSPLRGELLSAENFEATVKQCLEQPGLGIQLLLKLIAERPGLLSRAKAVISIGEVVEKHIFGSARHCGDIWGALELVSQLSDFASLKTLFTESAKQAVKLQRYITEKLSPAGVHFMLSLCKFHLHEGHNLELLDIFHATTSLIFQKFSANNAPALAAFKRVLERPFITPPSAEHCVVPANTRLAGQTISLHLHRPAYISQILLRFHDAASHFPNVAFLSADIKIDSSKSATKVSHILGFGNCYILPLNQEVRELVEISHVSYPSRPTLALGGITQYLLGYTSEKQAVIQVPSTRENPPPLADAPLSAEEQEALQSLPGSPKSEVELAAVVEQALTVADFAASTIAESLRDTNTKLTQKHAEKCFQLWQQLPANFPCQEVENHIQSICRTVFAKVSPSEAANVALGQLRAVLVKGKSTCSHKALLRLVQGLGFPSNFISAYLERYINTTPASFSLLTGAQLNASTFKTELAQNFLFLHALAFLGEKLAYTVDKASAIFQQQGRIKLGTFTDVSLPNTRPQKNRIIANTLRAVLELRNERQLHTLVRALMLSLIAGMKSEITEAAKYLYGDAGRGQQSLMVRLITFTLETNDPELKMLMLNLCSITKNNSSLQTHVDGPLWILNKMKQAPPRSNPGEWVGKVRFLLNLINWKTSSKVIDFIFSLTKLQGHALQTCGEFWGLLGELLFQTRSHFANHLHQVVAYIEHFFTHVPHLSSEYYRVAGIVGSLLVDQKREETSPKSKLSRLVFRALFRLLEEAKSNQELVAAASLFRQISSQAAMPLPEERAVVLIGLVNLLLARVTKWNLDDPSGANSNNAIYSALAYEALQKIFIQKDPEHSAQAFVACLSDNELQDLAQGLVRWFFLTQDLKDGKEPNSQEHQIRIITDGLYRLFVALAQAPPFRRRAVLATLEAVKTLDQAVMDPETGILPAVDFAEHSCSIYGGLLRLCITSRQDLLFFLHEAGGLDFLEKRLSKGKPLYLPPPGPIEQEVKAAPKGSKASGSTPASKTLSFTPKPRKPAATESSKPKATVKKAAAAATGDKEKSQAAGDKASAAAEKVQTECPPSDLFEDESLLSVKQSGHFWNLTHAQVGESVDTSKAFSRADIKVDNLANRKMQKIEQRSSAKYNKDFNWTGEGWQGDAHTGLTFNYNNERQLSFQLGTTIELTSVLIGFNGVLQPGGTNRPHPPAVTMNFGLTQDLRHSVRLERLEDLHFGQAAVYGVNLHSIPPGAGGVKGAAERMRRIRARFVNFHVEKGYYAGLRKFTQHKQLTQNTQETLKFIEINGFPITQLGDYQGHILNLRQTSTLSFLAELAKDKRLQAAQSLGEMFSTLDPSILRRFVQSDTNAALEFLLALVQDAPEQTADEVLKLTRELIMSDTPPPARLLRNFAINVAFNFNSEAGRPELASVVGKTAPFLALLLQHLHDPAQREKVELLAKTVSQILLTAAKEHTFSTLPAAPLELLQRPSVSDILELARQAMSSEELMDLLTLFLNPPLGLRVASFTTPELLARCLELESTPEANIPLVRSIIAASDGANALADFAEAQTGLAQNIEKVLSDAQADALLVSKVQEWTERDEIRRRLVKERMGISLYKQVKQHFSANEKRLEVVSQVVQSIKKLVYGFPDVEEELAALILEDEGLFLENNKLFNKHVLFPLLFGEETVSLSLNPFLGPPQRFLSLPDEAPFSLEAYARSLATEGFPFATSVLSAEHKRAFSQFLASTLSPAQLLSLQFFKTGSEYNMCESNFGSQCPMVAFGSVFSKSAGITYTCGLVSVASVDGIMNQKLPASPSTFLVIYTDEPRHCHLRLKTTNKKSVFFKLEKKHYFPTKQNFLFKLENPAMNSSDPYQISFCTKKPKDQALQPMEPEEFKGLKWPSDTLHIPLKMSSASAQSMLQLQSTQGKLKDYQFAHPFFEQARHPLEHFSFLDAQALARNPWHDIHRDFVARLNPKWRIPKGASLRYVLEHLFNVKGATGLPLFMRGRPLDPKTTLGELQALHTELRQEIEVEGASEWREGRTLGQTVEVEVDLSQLLKLYHSESPKVGGGARRVYKKWKKGEEKEQATAAAKEEPPMEYLPEMGLFQCFSRAAGFNKIVQLLRSKLGGADPKQAEEVMVWLEEIEAFSQFPSFETLLLQNKECRDFFLEDVMRADNIVEKFMEKKGAIGNVPFETLSQLFTSSPDPELRKMALEKNILSTVLKNVELLTREKPRRYQEDYDPEEEARKEQERHEKAVKEAEQRKKEEEAKKNTEKVKRKGVGYVTNEGQVWNIQKYMSDRQARNERVASFLNLVASLFDSEDWSPEQAHVTPLVESCLLPLLESSFSAGSLVNLVKDYPLVMAQFHMVCVFSRHAATAKLLLKLDQHYVPPQTISILELLAKLKDLADIFLGCLGQQQSSMKTSDPLSENKAEELARAILDTYRQAERGLNRFGLAGDESAKLQDALALPLPQAYIALLKDLRFDYMSLERKDGKAIHFYESNAAQETVSPQSKMVRLAQELADLSTALPIDHTNAIFVRVDRERIDMMKAVIFGANGTPYAHGAFQYDLYLPQKYPEVSPKCNLTTTGGGQVRFNPNLYSSGKVCLSLLGTWRGNANENWDPKVSTILQVLLSIQAVVMSEEVYFNEPGYENTAGTPDGERKNEGYSNIVRYSNIKFAMVEAIRKPPRGFESVVRRHFYLKKEQILKEVKSWLPIAEKNEANYTGLVSSHNWKWCEIFKKEKLAYKEHLQQVIEELEIELHKLEPPSLTETRPSSAAQQTQEKKKEVVDLKAEAEKLELVDVADEDEATQQAAAKEMDIADQKVKDRWSRYIGAMGVDAVAKQSRARLLVSGAGGVGIELAKNLVLAGCKSFTLHDVRSARWSDLSAQFFLSQKDIGRNRAMASVAKLQQLNYYVKVAALTEPLEEEVIKAHDVVVLTDPESLQQLIEVARLCRKHSVKFLLAESAGLCARMFADFGPKFPVLDKNGEELQDVMLKEIKADAKEEGKAVAELLEGTRHNYEDGDEVELQEVVGLQSKSDAKKSVNGQVYKVKVISPSKFFLEGLDLGAYTAYEQNGLCKQLKQKIEVDFAPFEEAVLTKEPKFDGNLYIADFEKMANWPLLHVAMLALTRWRAEQGGGLPPQSSDDVKSFIEMADEMANQGKLEADAALQRKIFTALAMTAKGVFNPLCAFIGGFAAQEVVKAITNKFSPLNQLLYFDALELLPDFPKQEKKEEEQKQEEKPADQPDKEKEKPPAEAPDKAPEAGGSDEPSLTAEIEQLKDVLLGKPKKEQEEDAPPSAPKPDYLEFWEKASLLKHKYENTRNEGLASSVGPQLVQKLAKGKVFMVGSGAIGCELLKNYAMLSVGTQGEGMLVLTDPDHIQVSNLNRQFLFREKHLRKPKASTAAAAAIQMNPQLKGRVYARLDKVHPGTEHIFTDKFFTDLTVVTNALDNIQARRYVDQRCVAARTPLLESGTLGPKGHVQVVLPHKTESYGSQADPENNTDIPHCTLKMFPEETLHCVEWARDQFSKLFSQNPDRITRALDPEFIANGPKDSADLSALRKAVKLLRKRPTDWLGCVTLARVKFQKHFVNDIKQLLHVYPLDKKTAEGRPFWASPKRPPHETPFDPTNELQLAFVVSFAKLVAYNYGIETPKDLRSDKAVREKVGSQAAGVEVAAFKLDKKKLESIEKEVASEKEEKKQQEETKEEQEEDGAQLEMEDVPQLMKELAALKSQLSQGFAMKSAQFEKDDDENGHIDFIHSMANCRAMNYKLEAMSWLNVKLKAGRIVPALATTTAAVSALQTLEMVKLFQTCKLEAHRNIFLNLALPSMTASEPGEAEVVELRQGLKVTLWDRWEVSKGGPDITLGGLLGELESTYKLKAQDVMLGNKALFLAAVVPEKDREKVLAQKVKELAGVATDAPYVDLTVTFTEEAVEGESGKVLAGVPPVRVVF